jgi:hypothetical protein
VSVSAVLYPRWPPLQISIFSNGGHLGYRTALMDTILKGDHPRTFAYFDRLCKLEKRGDEILKKCSPLKLLSQSQPNFAENDYFIKLLFLLSKWFQIRRLLWEFPIVPFVKLSSAVAAILVRVLKCRTQFGRGPPKARWSTQPNLA